MVWWQSPTPNSSASAEKKKKKKERKEKKTQGLKNQVIDFQKSWVEKYIVKNVITKAVTSLYADLLQQPAQLTAGRRAIYMQT